SRSQSFTDEPADSVRRPARSDEVETPALAESQPPARLFDRRQRSEVQHDSIEHSVQAPPRLTAPRAECAARDSAGRADVERYELLIPPQENELQPTALRTTPFPTSASSKPDAKAHFTNDAPYLLTHRPAARAKSQPDEIQIHIGRIEVTAVQPPAPRVP